MGSVGSVLVAVIPTALGSTVVSTLITVYVTQSGERRRARAEVRDASRVAELAAVASATSAAEIREVMDGFARVAMIARLPMLLVNLFFVANMKVWSMQHMPPGEFLHPDARRGVVRFRLRRSPWWWRRRGIRT